MQDVDIEDQIRNAQFMYPEKPWRSISREAVTCIQRCLVVSHETRYTVDQALADRWLGDRQCSADLARLEEEARIQTIIVRVNLYLLSILIKIAMTCDIESHIILSQVGCQWLASETDQADYLMEKTYI